MFTRHSKIVMLLACVMVILSTPSVFSDIKAVGDFITVTPAGGSHPNGVLRLFAGDGSGLLRELSWQSLPFSGVTCLPDGTFVTVGPTGNIISFNNALTGPGWNFNWYGVPFTGVDTLVTYYATVDLAVAPDVVHLGESFRKDTKKTEGKPVVTCYVTDPDLDVDVLDIDPASITIGDGAGNYAPVLRTAAQDADSDGTNETLMVKVLKEAVAQFTAVEGVANVYLEGQLSNGMVVKGSSTVIIK